MFSIKVWMQEHNISSHSIAAVILGAVTLYTTDSTVFNLVNGALASHPKALAALGGIVTIVLKYSGSHSTQGQLALIAGTPPQQVATAAIAVKEAAAPPAPPAAVAPNLDNALAAAAAATKDVPPK